MRSIIGFGSAEAWLKASESIYIFALIIAAVGSIGMYSFGRTVRRQSDERIAAANTKAENAVLTQKALELKIEHLRKENLELEKELHRERGKADRRWKRIAGENVE